MSSRTGYFIEFFEKFLAHITSPEHKSPLDFFSWHSYADRESNIAFARYAREMLDKHGLTHTESILNEWNPGTHRRGTLEDATHIAAMLIAMQNSPVDMLAYYDGQMESSYGGLFNPLTLTPFKAFYAMKAFGVLYRLGRQYSLEGQAPDGQIAEGVYALAAGDKSGNLAVLLVNTKESAVTITVAATVADAHDVPQGAYVLSILDDHHDLTPVATLAAGERFTLPAYAVAVLANQ